MSTVKSLGRREYQRLWKIKNPDKVKEYNRRNALSRDKEATREYWLLSNYGILKEDYQCLLEKQNGGCAICGSPPTENRKSNNGSLHVDHDKDTGIIRGLLCFNCNVSLGYLKHDVALIEKAKIYLAKGNNLFAEAKVTVEKELEVLLNELA